MSVKDAPLRRAARESLTDTLACSMTMEEGEGAPRRHGLFFDVRLSLKSRQQMDRGRRPIVKTLVQPLVIVKPEIAFDPGPCFRD